MTSGDRGAERTSGLACRERPPLGWLRAGTTVLRRRYRDLWSRRHELCRAAGAVVLGGTAAVLGTLVAEIAAVRGRVRDVPRPSVVDHGFRRLGEARCESVDQRYDEEPAHDGPQVNGSSLWMQTRRNRSHSPRARGDREPTTAVHARAGFKATSRPCRRSRAASRPPEGTRWTEALALTGGVRDRD
jgi:hypothetical protein